VKDVCVVFLDGGTVIDEKKSRTARTLLLLAIFFLSSVGWMTALSPSHRISQYGHTSWKIQDGYFGGQAVSITQTTDGYLWVGTPTGLFRFDGEQFVPWTSLAGEQLPSNEVPFLLGARDGSLWIGTNSGLVQWLNQRSIRYLNGKRINFIIQDEKGQIWVTKNVPGDYSNPICRIVDTDVRCYGYGTGEGAVLAAPVPLAEDASGNLWVGHDTALVRWSSGSLKVYRPAALQSHQGIGGVEALAAADDGSVWVGVIAPGHGGGLQHMVDGALKPFAVPKLNGETLEIGALLIDRQGNLWVGTNNQGVYRIHGTDVDHFGSVDGLSGDSVNQLFEDREGNLWVATSKGIDMFRDLRVITVTKSEGLSEDNAESVLAARDGTVWIGSEHLQALGRDGVFSDLGKGLPGNQVTSLLEDHAGRLWVGMDNTLWIREGGKKNGKFRQIKKQDGSAVGMVMGLTEDAEHNIWVETHGSPATLIRIQGLTVREEFPEPPIPLARKLAPDPQSGIWMGLVDGNLARFRSGKTEIFTFANHPITRVKALFAASDGSILGATEFGVVGWKNGKQQILTVRNGLPCGDINAVNSDDHGDLWLYAACGLIEIPKDEVQRWWEEPEGKLRAKVFDALDGVQSGVSHFNSSSKAPDGRLWFANASVVQTVDPADMTGNTVPPPVHVIGVVADRKSYPPQEAVKLPALTRDLEIDYTATSFAAPKKVLFRYMLEGHDAGWLEPGTRRQAFYNDLRPGRYRFHVIASNNDGVWNEAGAFLDFSIAPAYYQTTWFRILCGAALLLLLWFIYQFRLRQLQHQFNIGLEARVNERTRIARELHDTLLQSFQGLVIRFQAARNQLPHRPEEASEALDSALVSADRAMEEGRSSIQELRSELLEKSNIEQMLLTMGKELVSSQNGEYSSPPLRVIVEGTRRAMRAMITEEIYRIARELLRNAYRHAHARSIEAELRYDDDAFVLIVRDDGKGIDPIVLKGRGRAGHWGLPGAYERAEGIGARLDIWSEAGAGTEVRLTVPAAIAYEKSSHGGRFRLFRKTRIL